MKQIFGVQLSFFGDILTQILKKIDKKDNEDIDLAVRNACQYGFAHKHQVRIYVNYFYVVIEIY